MQILGPQKAVSPLFQGNSLPAALPATSGSGLPGAPLHPGSLGFCSLAQGSWHHCPSPHRWQHPMSRVWGALKEGKSGGHWKDPGNRPSVWHRRPTSLALASPGNLPDGFSLSLHECLGEQRSVVGAVPGWRPPREPVHPHLASGRFSLMLNKETVCHTCGC